MRLPTDPKYRLKGLLASHEWIQMEVEVGRANLPSTTEFNKGWNSEDDVIRGLDQMAHRYDYSYPRSFVEAIGFICKVADRAVHLLKDNEEVIITSDHGLSRASFHKGNVVPTPAGAKVRQWGRFAELEGDFSPESRASSAWVNDGNKIFLAVHGRFAGGAGSVGEIHGGATPEEILVPVIRLYKTAVRAVSVKEKLQIKVLDPVVKLDIKGVGHVKLQLSGPVQQLVLIVGTKSFAGKAEELNRWDVTIDGLKAGTYRGRLECEGVFFGEVSFEVTKGIKEEDMGL
jgi:hypothetical protein